MLWIQEKLTHIIKDVSHDEFIFDFLLAYNIPRASVVRARKWALNKLDTTW